MTTPVIVVGHKNPDNDSICSAIGYAYLKNALAERDGTSDQVHYVPYRLGPLPPESAWILAKNGVEPPEVIPNVYSRVEDVMTRDPISIASSATILEAGRLLRSANVRAIIVNDDENHYEGIISTRSIANRYISATDKMEGTNSSMMRVAADLIESLDEKVGDLMETEVLVLQKEDILKDAIEELLDHPLREAVVVDDEGYCIGILTRTDVATKPRRKVILVDHNETRQAALGIEEADVIEIIDHHRIADVTTSHPIRFLNLPVGSTATIVTMEFRNNHLDIPPEIAAVLLSAVMTDTVLLKSPTATAIDADIAEYLANIIGCDVIDFGLDVFRTRGAEDHMPVRDLVEADSKEFQLGDSTILICQHETVDLPKIMAREPEIRAHMSQIQQRRGYEFVLLMVTDIMAEGSQFFVEGDSRLPNRVFDARCDQPGGAWMPGILSRKKQVAPRVLGA